MLNIHSKFYCLPVKQEGEHNICRQYFNYRFIFFSFIYIPQIVFVHVVQIYTN